MPALGGGGGGDHGGGWGWVRCVHSVKFYETRRSGHYAPILLAPAEGWGMGSGQLVGARTGIIYIYSKQNNLYR